MKSLKTMFSIITITTTLATTTKNNHQPPSIKNPNTKTPTLLKIGKGTIAFYGCLLSLISGFTAGLVPTTIACSPSSLAATVEATVVSGMIGYAGKKILDQVSPNSHLNIGTWSLGASLGAIASLIVFIACKER